MTVKKAITAAAVFVAAVAVFGLIWFSGNDSGKTESNFTTETGDYTVDEWFEKEEREGYTLTKFITMGEPSIMVEYETEGYPVSVTISKGTKTTLIYSADYYSYDMYIEYRNDKYVISKDFENADEIAQLAFDWSEGTFMGTYSEDENGTVHTDEQGNIYYYDSEGNEVVYKSFDEI